jgi:hypothetical protein
LPSPTFLCDPRRACVRTAWFSRGSNFEILNI